MTLVGYIARLLRWFRGHRWAVAAITLCLTLEMAFNAFVPLAFRHLIDHAITPRDAGVLAHVLIALALATLVTTAAGLAGDYVYARLSADVLLRIRQRLFEHLQALSPAFFQRTSAGEITARYSTDLAGVEQTLASWIPWGWKPALDVIGYNAVMFTIDWRLALLAQLVWPMTLLGPRIFAPRASAAAEARKDHEAAVLTAVGEATAGQAVVRAFGLEATMAERFRAKLGQLARTTVRGAFYGAALERSAGTGILFLQIVVLGVGGWMAFAGLITVGSLAAFYSVYLALSYALYYLAQYSTSLIHSAAGLKRIEQILDERPAVVDLPGAAALPPLQSAITVRDVVFEPVPGKRILDGVSLTIRRGQSVALVGPSGSGKTTLLTALMRGFDPDRGTIELDGRDVRTVTRASLVAQGAVVFQDSFLYNLSVRENVRLGRPDASDAAVEAACRDAEIHDVIRALPQGYDTLVGERGALLSGGQRQRVAIARALLRDPAILFLDEATSALDPGTEAAVNATLRRLAGGRTVIAVTHRLQGVTGCDRIFVLNHGRLVEEGTHAALLARGGLYAALWRKQDGLQPSDDGTRVDVTPARLRDIPLLSGLTDDVLHELATAWLVTESVAAGVRVVEQGAAGHTFYLIARGRVEVLLRDDAGAERRLALLEEGDNFGELALLQDSPRTASVRTLTPCLFLTLRRQHFHALLAKSPQALAAILRQQAERLPSTNTASAFVAPAQVVGDPEAASARQPEKLTRESTQGMGHRGH